MSRAPPQDDNGIEPRIGLGPGTGDYQYPPQSAQNQASHGVSNFVDGSGPIFSMYLDMASEEDKKMTEGWKADADGILIFDIRHNPQDTSNFYLANIYQTISDPNQSNISLPSSPPPFSPPTYAIWVNSLWLLSLVISISCALLATLLQQWARRYLKANQLRYSPHKRARIRAFFAEGVDKFLLPWAVEALPTLLHVSLFLFFAGLAVFLWNVNITIFKLVLSWVGVCTALYGCITIIPIFRHDSPYYTPLSLPVWNIVNGVSFLTFRALRRLARLDYFSFEAFDRFQALEGCYRKLLVQGMQKATEETALDASSEIDTRAFLWVFDNLDEDNELERFFSGLPGFRSSKVVDDPLLNLTNWQKWKLLDALIGLSDRTFSSDLLPEPVKRRRAVICSRAIDPADVPRTISRVLHRVVYENQYWPVQSAGIARLVRDWGNSKGENTSINISAIVSSVIAKAQWRDDHWFAIASDEFGVPESVLRGYAAHSNSLSLAILIHITRQQFNHYRERSWPTHMFSKVLEAALKFDVQDTSPELQQDFCALWNQIVLKAQIVDSPMIELYILRPIHNAYIVLHRDTGSTSTRFSASTDNEDHILKESTAYRVCNVAGHLHDDYASTSLAHTALRDGAALAPASLASTNAPSSVPALHHGDETSTNVPPLDNDSFHPAHQTAIETLRIPASPLDPVTARAIQGEIDTSATTIPSTLKPSVSTPLPTSFSSTSPPGAAPFQNIADRCTSSDVLDVPLLPSPAPVLGSILSTGSHSSLLAPAAPGPPRLRLVIAPDPSAAREGENSVEATLHKERGALDTPSTIQEHITAALDLPPPSPSPPSVTDVAIAGSSRRSLRAKRTGDHPPHPLHSQYDIV